MQQQHNKRIFQQLIQMCLSRPNLLQNGGICDFQEAMK